MSGLTTFLIVDDTAVVRRMLRHAIVRARPAASILEAASVGEARCIMQTAHVSAVVTDYHLPDGNGIDVLEAARQHHSTTAVIVMSADAWVAPDALAAGATAFFNKPVDMRQFTALLTTIGESASAASLPDVPYAV